VADEVGVLRMSKATPEEKARIGEIRIPHGASMLPLSTKRWRSSVVAQEYSGPRRHRHAQQRQRGITDSWMSSRALEQHGVPPRRVLYRCSTQSD
jgi:hypothetical protein